MDFWKLEGSGNDFVVIDDRDGKVEEFLKRISTDKEEFVRRVCARLEVCSEVCVRKGDCGKGGKEG